jgi:ankyrin repeat protein
MAHGRNRRRALRAARAAARAAALLEPPPTFLDMPCDLLSCLGPVASTPGYEREMDGTQRLCRAARDDTMLGAATADLRYVPHYKGPRSRLEYACSVNDHARIAWLVECGARDVRAATQPGYTGGAALLRRLAGDPLVDASLALVVAAHVGVADVVAPLVARGAQLERAVRYRHNDTFTLNALQAASLFGHVGVVTALLAAGAAVDAAGDSGMTALLHAVKEGKLTVVRKLVAAGADVKAADRSGMTALMHAVRLSSLEVVRALVEAGADVGAADESGETALMHAAETNNVKVAQALVAAGADVNVRDEGGCSAAAAAYRTYAFSEAVAAYLCALPQAEPGTHILAAACLGDVERVRDFIARGASVEERDREGATCLMLAATRGHAEVVRVLLGAGADVAANDEYGDTVMSCAVGRLAILAALLARFEVGGDARRQAQLNNAHGKAVKLGTPEGKKSARMLRAAGAVLTPPMEYDGFDAEG